MSVLCEDPDLVPAIPEALGVFVDVDPGMNRTGVPAADAARIQAVAQTAGGRFRGLHWYDGHHAEADLEERTAAVQAGHARVVELVRGLERSGVPVAEVVTSGTPAFLSSTRPGPLAALAATTHRLSPGTVVFHDVRSEEECPGLGLEPAALVLCRVVSLPGPDRVTADAGTKSIAAEAGDPCAEAIGWPGLVADRPSEEHLPFRLVAGPRPARGTPLLLVPRHVCPTVNLAESALLLEEGRLVAVERVAARAHELLVDAAPGSDA